MDGEWDESWNKMEPFSVTVVPSDPQSGLEPEQSNTDLFQDMQPVIKKARKVGHSVDALVQAHIRCIDMFVCVPVLVCVGVCGLWPLN